MSNDHTDNADARADAGDTGDGMGNSTLSNWRRSGAAVDLAGGVTPIPASIVVARSKIMTTVEAVKKSNYNEHGRYKFASTDDVYAVLARKMGEVQLNCDALEVLCEIKRIEKPAKEKGQLVRDKEGNFVTETVQWAHIVYQFVWSTPEDTWTDPNAKRTLFIQVTGAQTFQAAQSFAEKAYLRSSFKLPSGDMDLDSMPQTDDEESSIALNGGKKRKSSAEGKRDGSVKQFNDVRAEISGAVNGEHLREVYLTYCDDNGPWAGMPERWAQTLQEDYETRMSEFDARQAAE